MGRAPLGRSDAEATTGWTEGKPWEIAWGELRWEEAIEWEFVAVGTSFSRQIASMRLCRKIVRPRLVKRCAKIGRGTCIASLAGSGAKNAQLLA